MKTIAEEAEMYSIRKENEFDALNGFKAGAEFAQRWIPSEEFKEYSNNDNILVKFDDGNIRRFTEEFPFAIATHCRLINIQ